MAPRPAGTDARLPSTPSHMWENNPTTFSLLFQRSIQGTGGSAQAGSEFHRDVRIKQSAEIHF